MTFRKISMSKYASFKLNFVIVSLIGNMEFCRKRPGTSCGDITALFFGFGLGAWVSINLLILCSPATWFGRRMLLSGLPATPKGLQPWWTVTGFIYIVVTAAPSRWNVKCDSEDTQASELAGSIKVVLDNGNRSTPYSWRRLRNSSGMSQNLW